MTGSDLVGWLIQLGVPGAVFTAVGYSVRAWRQRRKLISEAPDKKIDTSLARLQQAAIVQDGILDNTREYAEVQRKRAEDAEQRLAAAEARERALQSRLDNTN